MNNTKTPTVKKKMFSLRLPLDTYKKIRICVQKKQEEKNYDGYSINDFLTEIIEEKLKEKIK